MTIGNELDETFYKLSQRLTAMESKYEFVRSELNKVTDRGFNITDVESELERLNDRIDEECCDSRVESLEDDASNLSERIEDLESYKANEEDVEYIVDNKMDDRFDEAMDSVLEDLDLASLLVRVAELESRLNQPTLGARVLRWLREGPSIKEVATGWYAGMRRGS